MRMTPPVALACYCYAEFDPVPQQKIYSLEATVTAKEYPDVTVDADPWCSC